MALNFIVGFVIPWIIFIFHLNLKDKTLLVLIAPFGTFLAYTINDIGIYFELWKVQPFDHPLSEMPFNIGLYPVLGCYLIYFIKKYKHPYIVIILLSLFTTGIEYWYLIAENVNYGNGWSIYWTILSYVIPFTIAYWFYLYLKKLNLTN